MVLAALLVLAAAVSVSPVEKIDCPDCNGVGSIEIACPVCSGSGVVDQKVKKRIAKSLYSKDLWATEVVKVPCRACFRGAYKPTGKATGKKKITCKTCKGQKKVKVQKP